MSEFILSLVKSYSEKDGASVFSEGRDTVSVSQIRIIFRISLRIGCVTKLNLKNRKFETLSISILQTEYCPNHWFIISEGIWIECFTSLSSSFLLSTEETCLVKQTKAHFVFEDKFLASMRVSVCICSLTILYIGTYLWNLKLLSILDILGLPILKLSLSESVSFFIFFILRQQKIYIITKSFSFYFGFGKDYYPPEHRDWRSSSPSRTSPRMPVESCFLFFIEMEWSYISCIS